MMPDPASMEKANSRDAGLPRLLPLFSNREMTIKVFIGNYRKLPFHPIAKLLGSSNFGRIARFQSAEHVSNRQAKEARQRLNGLERCNAAGQGRARFVHYFQYVARHKIVAAPVPERAGDAEGWSRAIGGRTKPQLGK
jgi:hypothetical protein